MDTKKGNGTDHDSITLFRQTREKIGILQTRKRAFNKINWDNVLQVLYDLDLRPILDNDDPNICTNMLTGACNYAIDTEEEVKTRNIRKNHAPFLSEDDINLIKTKNDSYSIYRRNRCQQTWDNYRNLRNQVSSMLKRRHKEHWDRKLKTLNSKELWQNLREFHGWATPGAPTGLLVDGRITTNHEEICNGVNTALINKVDDLKENIPRVQGDPLERTRKFVENKNVPEFDLGRVSVTDVKKAIKSHKNSHAEGHDGISTVMLKKIGWRIAPYLAHIINKSFEKKIFPDCWKLAKIAPLHKKGDPC